MTWESPLGIYGGPLHFHHIGQKCRGHISFFGNMFIIIYKQPVGDVYIYMIYPVLKTNTKRDSWY